MKGIRTKVTQAVVFIASLFYLVFQGQQMPETDITFWGDTVDTLFEHWEGVAGMAVAVWNWVLRNKTDTPARPLLGL